MFFNVKSQIFPLPAAPAPGGSFGGVAAFCRQAKRDYAARGYSCAVITGQSFNQSRVRCAALPITVSCTNFSRIEPGGRAVAVFFLLTTHWDIRETFSIAEEHRMDRYEDRSCPYFALLHYTLRHTPCLNSHIQVRKHHSTAHSPWIGDW